VGKPGWPADGTRWAGEAVDALDRALNLEPFDPVAWFHRGQALEALARFDEAVEASDLRLPFGLAAGLAFVNFVFGLFMPPESLEPEQRRGYP
jgi:tetratricopeptide (TPR) repeat protein